MENITMDKNCMKALFINKKILEIIHFKVQLYNDLDLEICHFLDHTKEVHMYFTYIYKYGARSWKLEKLF